MVAQYLHPLHYIYIFIYIYIHFPEIVINHDMIFINRKDGNKYPNIALIRADLVWRVALWISSVTFTLLLRHPRVLIAHPQGWRWKWHHFAKIGRSRYVCFNFSVVSCYIRSSGCDLVTSCNRKNNFFHKCEGHGLALFEVNQFDHIVATPWIQSRLPGKSFQKEPYILSIKK